MHTAVAMGQLPTKANGTANFLAKLNNIFYTMNWKSKFDGCCPSGVLYQVQPTDRHLRTSLQIISSRQQRVTNCGPLSTYRRILYLSMDWHKRGPVALATFVKGPHFIFYDWAVEPDPLENEFVISRQICGYDRTASTWMFRKNIKYGIE